MLVLPVRIELTTSALPRMRSTTELRQPALAGSGAYGEEGGGGQGRMAKEMSDQDERLAAALRDNLKRRKTQTREREAQVVKPPEPPSRD